MVKNGGEKRSQEEFALVAVPATRRRLSTKQQPLEEPPAAAAAPAEGAKVPKVNLDRGAVSGMLTQLKYAANPESNKKGTFLFESQKALAAYRAMPDGQKPAFLKEY